MYRITWFSKPIKTLSQKFLSVALHHRNFYANFACGLYNSYHDTQNGLGKDRKDLNPVNLKEKVADLMADVLQKNRGFIITFLMVKKNI